MSAYDHDPVTCVWLRQDAASLSYSDGSEVENRMLSILKNTEDVSTLSPQLANAIRDWPTEYHFSSARHNLLRPFAIGPRQRVLELGSGCGALTRYLGESGATVVAVEGSLPRAGITAERCRDLPNVSVYCDDLMAFEAEGSFDYVLLIGVLEWTPVFMAGDEPVGRTLSVAARYLAEDGTLLLAIENRLGLKYFNGCAEDHIGIPYFGIHDLYGRGTPVTFGRAQISTYLRAAGFQEQEFFHPFPDYKLPGLILSEAGSKDVRLRQADLLLPYAGWGCQETYHRAFDEALVWQSIAANGLMGEFSNSFLIRARKSVSSPVDWLVKAYGRTQRHTAFLTESTITPGDGGSLEVTKRSLYPDVSTPIGLFRQVLEDSTYLHGRLLEGDIRRAFAQGADIDDLAVPFLPWIAFLRHHEAPCTEGIPCLPGHFVDCVPANLIVGEDGELHFIDREWICVQPVPLAWVTIRGIMIASRSCLDNSALAGMSCRSFIEVIASRAGLIFSEADYVAASAMEARFHEFCYGAEKVVPDLAGMLDQEMLLFHRLSDAPALRRQLMWHRQELARVKATRSWRFTSPFRVAWNLGRWIMK